MNVQAPAEIGHNNPDASSDPLRERLAEDHAALIKRRDDLVEALSRVPEVIDSDEMDGRASDFVKQLTACAKSAETARVGEKEVFLDAGRKVDGFFKGIIDPVEKVKKTVIGRLDAYKRKKADEERRAREEQARREREEAARLAREAEERATEMRSQRDLDGALEAERQAQQAQADAEKARREAEAKAAELSRTRGDMGAVSSLRTFWDVADIDRTTLDLDALRPHIAMDALEKAARAFVRAGGRELRGARVFENTSTVVR